MVCNTDQVPGTAGESRGGACRAQTVLNQARHRANELDDFASP
jgi:hypothetical protein